MQVCTPKKTGRSKTAKTADAYEPQSMHPEENGAVADRFAKQNALNIVRLP